MNGLSVINIELSSRCCKKCWMCGRRKLDNQNPPPDWGDMPKEMVYEISKEVPKGIVVQFHNNGDPLLFDWLGMALRLFSGNIRCFNTNAKLLLERNVEIIGNLETLTISVIQDDPEGDEQYETVCRFLEKKGDQKPFMVYRLLGRVESEERWKSLPGIVAKRILHNPMGSRDYQKETTKPEIGICLDLLTHLAIDRYGNTSMCVRFDPEAHLRLGNIKERTLYSMWTGSKRKTYIQKHIEQKRHELPGCKSCEYWGVPRGE